MNIGARVGWSGWVGLYGRPSCLVCTRRKVLSPRQFWGTHTSRGAVRPGTRKGPSTPNLTPCHYMLSIPAPPPAGPSPGGGAGPRPVVARRGRVERWGPCGCQATRLDRAVWASCQGTPISVGGRGRCPPGLGQAQPLLGTAAYRALEGVGGYPYLDAYRAAPCTPFFLL